MQPAWDRKIEALMEIVRSKGPMGAPFSLTKGETVVDPKKFHEAMKADYAQGPRGPRAIMGGFQKDLRVYAEILKAVAQ